jgi:hypothetical protein
MQLVRSHGRSIHKRSTLEILVRGKMLGEAARMFSQPHRFEKFTYTTPTSCDFCQQLLWGFSKNGRFWLIDSAFFLGQGFSLVVRAECWHARDLGSNPWQGRPLCIWMYTPSVVSILGMDMCAV